MWFSLGWSNVELITSPFTDLSISVTSSGLSSTSSTIIYTSGLFVATLFAISFKIVVLPAFGGDTISPLWPFPIGAIRSIILAVILWDVVSSLNLCIGYIGVND